MSVERVVIVGVGLIGGSFALAIREAGFRGVITGVSSPATVEAALNRGVIDNALPLRDAVAQADLVYLAQPIGRILHTLRELDPFIHPGALVTDAGSTKQAIVSTAREHLLRARFLGGHPMAGKEVRGVEEAEASLFRGRPYVLTPARPEALNTPAAAELLGWIRRFGARPVILGADEHDRLAAAGSHLPQLLSTALSSYLAEFVPEARDVAGPGLLDSTRLALSSYDLWRDIIATNPEPIDAVLTGFIQKLEYFRDQLRTRQLQEEFLLAAKFASDLRSGPDN